MPVEFADGTHRVGTEIGAGTYASSGTTGFCYWERRSSVGGDKADLIANSAGAGRRVVTIDPSDHSFVSQDCGNWTADLSPRGVAIADGVWLVGTDLQPGRYQNNGRGTFCAWERLSGFGGTTGESIEAGSTEERMTVDIDADDRGFSSSGCGEWTSVD